MGPGKLEVQANHFEELGVLPAESDLCLAVSFMPAGQDRTASLTVNLGTQMSEGDYNRTWRARQI